MIIIERHFPNYQKKKFENVTELTDWAYQYAEDKGCDVDSYIRTVPDEEGYLVTVEDKEYTLSQLFYDGWREVAEDEDEE
jgi:hypothetical protein